MIKKLLVTLAILGLATTAFAQVKEPDVDNGGINKFQLNASFRQTPLITEDFEGGIPGSWTVTDNAPGGFTTVWSDLAGCGEGGNFTNGSGNCACVSTDIAGPGVEVDTELITDTYDFSGNSDLVLAFTANYQNLGGSDFFDVDYSIDGGATWNNILSWNEDHGSFRSPPGEDVALDMSGADGSAANVRFYHYDPNTDDWDWYVQVDDMVIEGSGAGDGGGAVPTTTGIGIALMVLILLGSSAYFLRRRATN